jgi:hypothetical protein
MATNDKAFRAAFAMPLVTQSAVGGKSALVINIPKAFLVVAGLMLALLGANLLLACSLTFDCKKFMPGPAYLGCFRGHDRLFIAACTYYGLVLPLVFIGYYARFNGLATDKERNWLLGSGLAICIFLPMLALTDEKNAVHVLPFEPLYSLSVWGLVLSCVFWVVLAYSCISRSQSQHNVSERRWFIFLRLLLILATGLAILMLLQWHYSYTNHESGLINAWMGSLSEWVLSALAVLAPVVFCQFLRGFSLTFSTQVSAAYERLEVEMKKLQS